MSETINGQETVSEKNWVGPAWEKRLRRNCCRKQIACKHTLWEEPVWQEKKISMPRTCMQTTNLRAPTKNKDSKRRSYLRKTCLGIRTTSTQKELCWEKLLRSCNEVKKPVCDENPNWEGDKTKIEILANELSEKNLCGKKNKMYGKNLQPYNLSAKLLRTVNIRSEGILSYKLVWE